MKTIEHWVGGNRFGGRSDWTAPMYDPARGVQPATVDLASADDVERCAHGWLPPGLLAPRQGRSGDGRLRRRDLQAGSEDVRVGTFDEAVALINSNPYGNGVALFNGDGALGARA